jgi:hypothetical protein
MKVYAVYETPSFIEKQRGQTLGSCITDGYGRDQVIADAEDFYCTRAEEEAEYGEGERDALLVTHDEKTDAESVEPITLKWQAVRDTYDGGRFDYYSSRGCK